MPSLFDLSTFFTSPFASVMSKSPLRMIVCWIFQSSFITTFLCFAKVFMTFLSVISHHLLISLSPRLLPLCVSSFLYLLAHNVVLQSQSHPCHNCCASLIALLVTVINWWNGFSRSVCLIRFDPSGVLMHVPLPPLAHCLSTPYESNALLPSSPYRPALMSLLNSIIIWVLLRGWLPMNRCGIIPRRNAAWGLSICRSPSNGALSLIWWSTWVLCFDIVLLLGCDQGVVSIKQKATGTTTLVVLFVVSVWCSIVGGLLPF